MKITLEKVFLIVSKDEKLIAKGVPRNRYICHVDEGDKKRILTYASKKKAESGMTNSGFFMSSAAQEYIKEKYPEYGNNPYISWHDVSDMFEVRELSVNYGSILFLR